MAPDVRFRGHEETAGISYADFCNEVLANDIVNTIRSGNGWTPLRNGAAAAESAAVGKLVIGGLKGSEQTDPDAHGHVVVVVAGPLDPTHNAYPKAYWGRLGGGGAEDQWTNFAWRTGDRDRVSYAEHTIGTPASPRGSRG